MFISNLLNSLIKFILTILSWIGKVFLIPVSAIIMGIFPDMTQYVQQVETFFNTYILKGMAFIRECFFNITGASRAIFNILITFYIARILVGASIRIIKFVLNTWRTFKGNAGGKMVE